MKHRILFITVVAVLFAFQGMALAEKPIDGIKANIKKSVGAIKAEVPSITVQEFKKIMDKGDVYFELVDVRTEAEFDAGYIEGTVWIPRGKAEWMVPAKITDPEVQIYIYCKAGSRGALVSKMLLEAGYTNVTNITDGFGAWVKAGYPYYNVHGQSVVTEGGYGKKPE